MNLPEIRASKKVYLLPEDIADVIESDPNTIRRQAHDDPGKLGFPTIVLGARVKIPRAGFLYFLDYGRPAP